MQRGTTAQLMGSTALGQLLGLAIAPILGRWLGPAAFGAFGVYLAVLGSLGGAASWRLGLAVPVPLRDEDASAVLAAGVLATLLSTVAVTIAVAAFGTHAAVVWLNAPDAASLLWLIPASILGVGFTDVLGGWCLRNREFPALVRQRVVRAVGTSGWQFVHALALRSGAWPLVWGEVVGRLASVAEMARLIWRREGQRLRALGWAQVRAALRAQRAFVAVATPAHLLNQLGQWVPVFLLASWWGAAAAGLYVVGQRVIGIPIGLIGDSAGQVYIADLAERARVAPARMRPLFRETVLSLGRLAALTAVVLILLGPVGFALGFGAEWRDAGRMVRWQGIALAAQLVAIPMAHTLVVLRFQRRQLVWDILRLVVTVAGFAWARWAGWDAVGAVAVHGMLGAVLYGGLTYASWRAVRARADASA